MTMINMHCESESQSVPPIPSWSCFNIPLLQEQIPAKGNVDYLPLVNCNPTQLSTVNAVFFKSLAIPDELETECIVLTFDFSFHVKAQQVRWNDAMYIERTVVRLGVIHSFMSFFSVIEKRFEDSGLADILLEAGNAVQRSLPGVMKGRHYNRSVRVLKIKAEALRRKLLSTFMDTQIAEKI